MEKIANLYFINLDRCPERQENFLKQCMKQNIPFDKIQKFQAIDGKTFYFPDEMINMFKDCDYFRTLKTYRENNMDEKTYKIALETARKIMGNQLSHFNVLNDIINNGYKYSIICQDDARFNDGFTEYIDKLVENLPENAELITIGLNKYADGSAVTPWDFTDTSPNDFEEEVVNDYVCKLKDTVNPCSLAYIVTLEGATNMVKHFLTVGFLKATDENFNEYLKFKDIFYCCRKVMVTSGDFESDIFSGCIDYQV
uniref:Glycosyl transferase family 25 domain-containing protein n=1 Tax=viral metagenome TaxID=1070528 RepID=A0A6C0JED8_9ZZZZ